MNRFLKGVIVLGLCLVVINIFSSKKEEGTRFLPEGQPDSSMSQEEGVIRSLQRRQLVFLCFSPNENNPFLKTVKSEISGIDTFYKGATNTFYINNNEAKGKPLFEKFELSDQNVVVYTLVPPGNVFSRLEGEQITKKNLLRPFSLPCSSSCGCHKKKK